MFASADKSERRAKTLAEAEREHIRRLCERPIGSLEVPTALPRSSQVKRTTLLDRMRRLGISRPS